MILSDISIKRPVLMTMVIMIFVVIGIFSLTRLGIELFPRIDLPFITVMTIYPGAGPEEVETLLNKPIEEEVGSISGVKNITSIAQEGVSLVFVELNIEQDIDVGAMDIKDKIDALRPDLPVDIEEPIVEKFEVGSSAFISLSLTGPFSLEEMYQVVDKTIKPELSKIPGLANVDIIGEKEREITIELSMANMVAYGISPIQIVQALALENWNLPAGRIEKGRSEYTLRLAGEFESVSEIASTRIQTSSGPIRLDQIADVKDTFAEMREKARFNLQPTIGIDLIKRQDANTVKVADLAFQTIDKLEKVLPEGLKIEVAQDQSQFIRDSIKDVQGNLVLGILFTALVLFMFLHNWRSTIIAAIAMPISILSTFILIDAAGFTLNMMTLMALALSVGILVVNAIVVLENIERLRESGLSLRDSAAKGASQIAIAVAASTLTNIVVFTPLAFMKGVVGKIFMPFGLTIAFATIFSLLVSFTLTPMMSSRPIRSGLYAFVALFTTGLVYISLGLTPAILLVIVAGFLVIAAKIGWVEHFGSFWNKGFTVFREDYRTGLKWAIHHKSWVVSFAVISLIIGLFLFRYVGSEFFPSYDERRMQVSVEMPAGSRLEETNRVITRIEHEISKFPEVMTIYTSSESLPLREWVVVRVYNMETSWRSCNRQMPVIIHLLLR